MIIIRFILQRFGYKANNISFFNTALTHKSFLSDPNSEFSNERLEFLGDSILNCIVAEILFEKFNDLDEGDLSRVRANLVKQQALYEIAQSLSLSDYLRLGEGELKSGGFRRPSILADTLEAIIAAIFIEAGFEWREPGCSMCLAMNADRLNPGERCASTSNRNFEGRQGQGGRTHLVSPSMAAAASVHGHFVDIRTLN